MVRVSNVFDIFCNSSTFKMLIFRILYVFENVWLSIDLMYGVDNVELTWARIYSN